MTFRDKEKLTDISDKATAAEAEHLEIARQDAARRMKRQQEPLADGSYAVLDCEECGEEIGEGRLRAAIQNCMCIHCATRAERRR